MSGIDRDRGAIIRMHPMGMRVAMYVDEPGVYYDERGGQVTAEVARRAGFRTDTDSLARKKQQYMAAFKARLEQDFEAVEASISEAEASGGEGVGIFYEREGQYSVRDSNGTRLTLLDADLETAKELYESIAGKPFQGKPEGEPKKAAAAGTKKAAGAKKAAEAKKAEAAKEPGANDDDLTE